MTDIYRRVKNLERQVQQHAAARTLENATISQGGLQITGGGGITVLDPTTGHKTFFAGNIEIPDGSGRSQMGFLTWRDDGSAALTLWDGGATPGHPHQQALQWYARNGRIVLADDTLDGGSLANPHIEGCGMANTDSTYWPATTSTAFTTVAAAFYEVQNPRLTWQVWFLVEAGITAQFRMMVQGVQVSATQTVTTAGTVSLWSTDADRPAGVNPGDVVYVELQAKVSSATGAKAKAQCLRFGGQQS